MPSRPDIRELASNVKEAFADCDRDTLLDILTFVVKEYVVEGPPPMLMHQAETIAELANLSFAQLVSALQTRLELPELALFAVDGETVSVRVGGVMHPLQPGRGAPLAAAADLPRPQAGVRVVEANVAQQTPAPAAAPVRNDPPRAGVNVQEMPTRAAPPPSRGLSLRGTPTGEGAPAAAPAPASQTPAPAPQATAQVPKADEAGGPSSSGDDAAQRFSLLELD